MRSPSARTGAVVTEAPASISG